MIINKFSFTALLLLCNILLLTAQVENKYAAGTVPLVDGKVVFTKEIKVNSTVSNDQLYDLVKDWMYKEYPEEKGSTQRVLLADQEQSYIVAQGEDKLVFKSKILMIDQADMMYQIIAKTEKGKCTLEFRNIKYDYEDYDKAMPAEKMISDKVALHKSGEKLNRHYDKFRTFTIDRIDELEKSLIDYLGQITVDEVKAKEVKPASILDVESVGVPVATGAMAGYKQMNADQLSESIVNMFKDSKAVVVVGKDGDAQVLTAAWSGTGNFGGKPVAMTFVNTDSVSNKDQLYTISFYSDIHGDALDKMEASEVSKRNSIAGFIPIVTPGGTTAFGEAWMVIECKKVTEQDSSESALQENAQSKKWKNNENPKLWIGEIVNVWAR